MSGGTTERSAVFVGGEDLTDEVEIAGRPAFVGTYSYIFKGSCRGNEVAVKVLKLVPRKPDARKRKFRRQVTVLRTMSHPNISPFYGYTGQSDLFGRTGAIISPWYSNGDASNFLEEKGQSLSVEDRINLWKGVVSGVCYLHGQDPQIVHGDLKPGNILIDDTGTPRICDIGLIDIYLEEICAYYDTTTASYNSDGRYVAPEFIEDETQVSTTAGDIWALGCLGLQFLHSLRPYQRRKHNRTGLIFQDIRRGVLPATRPAHTDARIQFCWPIIIGCWHELPDLRFNAQYVLFSLGCLDETMKADSSKGVHDNNTVAPQPISASIFLGSAMSDPWTYNQVSAAPHSGMRKSPQEPSGSVLPPSLPPSFRKEGPDWFATYNPRFPTGKSLDIGVLHQFNHDSAVCCVKFSEDGRYLATGSNRSVQIFEINTGILVCKLEDNGIKGDGDMYIRTVCFSPDGRYLATGGEDRRITIWDIAKKRIRKLLEGHEQEVHSLKFSSDGRLIVSGSRDKTVRIWHMKSGTSTVLSIAGPPSSQGNSAGGGSDTTTARDGISSDAEIVSVTISPNDQLVAAGSLDTVVRLWDATTGILLERLRGHRDSVWSVAFTSDGQGLVSGSLDKTLKYWELNTAALRALKEGQPISQGERYAKCLFDFVGYKGHIISLNISHDGQWIVSGSTDGGAQFWDKNGVARLRLELNDSVFSIDSSPVGGLLATGTRDQRAIVWRYAPFQSPYN